MIKNCGYSLFILMIVYAGIASAYDDQVTHPALTLKAISPQIDQYLKSFLGFPLGKQAELSVSNKKQSVQSWLQQGSIAEDSPVCRASNHFHNPLKYWDRAGLSAMPWPLCPTWDVTSYSTRHSALTWATGYDNYNGPIIGRSNQQMGWDNARTYFYSALTSQDKTAREDDFAKTFQSVGQVMHLLQDMAVPAHVRNDFWNSHVWTGGAKSETLRSLT